MSLLTPSQVFEAKDKPYKDVEIKEWGGMVRIATMSIEAREKIEAIASDEKLNKKNLRLKFLIACIVDENDELMFSEADIEKLSKKSSKVIDKLFAIAQAMNGITDNDVEELAKN